MFQVSVAVVAEHVGEVDRQERLVDPLLRLQVAIAAVG